MYKWLIIGIVTLTLLSGCQDRQVVKIKEVDQGTINTQQGSKSDGNTTPSPESLTNDSIGDSTDSETKSTPLVTSMPDVTGDEKIPVTSNLPESENNIIVAKSEDLETIDERTQILNEIDQLLDSTLSNLDEIESDALLEENMIDEGGLE